MQQKIVHIRGFVKVLKSRGGSSLHIKDTYMTKILKFLRDHFLGKERKPEFYL